MTDLPRCLRPPEGPAASAARAYRAGLPRIATARLILRPPVLEDFPVWAEIFAGDEAGFIGGPAGPEAAWEEFCVYVAGWLLHGHGLFAVEARDGGQCLGFVSFGLEWEDDEPELGWLFAAGARDRGYATEAAAAVRDMALQLYGPGGFVSYVDPSNTASARLAERLGAVADPAASIPGATVYRHGMEARAR